jgi:ATP-dependent Lon protease
MSTSTHSYHLRPRSAAKRIQPESESDYETDSDDTEYDPAYESESETEPEPISFANLGRRYRTGHQGITYRSDDEMSLSSEASSQSRRSPRSSRSEASSRSPRRQQPEKKWIRNMSPEEKQFLKGLSPEEKSQLFQRYGQLKTTETDTPLRFKILHLPPDVLSDASKRLIFEKLEHYQTMTEDNTEYAKYTYWIRSLERMPFGRYHTLLNGTPTPESISELLYKTKAQLDDVVYGHTETKHQLLMLMAQWISNPTSRGRCIGIQGPMGIGKTTLIKDGVSKALGLPFGFIALGGANDAAFLEGHGFTYEGATYGRIAEILIKHQTMNPILFFDELDKISESPKGDEISAILTHLTDPTQNTLFTDKYFGSIELDVSRCLMVFSFNDSSKIHPILKDRLSMVYVQGYAPDEKINIAQSYLLPKLYRQYNIDPDAIVLTPSVLRAILSQTPEEKGIRQFIQSLERIFGWLNMARYIPVAPFDAPIQFPFVVEENHLATFLRKNETDDDRRPPFSMYS